MLLLLVVVVYDALTPLFGAGTVRRCQVRVVQYNKYPPRILGSGVLSGSSGRFWYSAT